MSENVDVSEPPPVWVELWEASRVMLSSYGAHHHACEECNTAWDRLHAALMTASRPKVTYE
jgi:hypothetical protein